MTHTHTHTRRPHSKQWHTHTPIQTHTHTQSNSPSAYLKNVLFLLPKLDVVPQAQRVLSVSECHCGISLSFDSATATATAIGFPCLIRSPTPLTLLLPSTLSTSGHEPVVACVVQLNRLELFYRTIIYLATNGVYPIWIWIAMGYSMVCCRVYNISWIFSRYIFLFISGFIWSKCENKL